MIRIRLVSLRDRLLLLVILAMLPALGLAVFSNLEERRAFATDVQGSALRLARILTRHQEQLLEGTRELLLTLAALPEARPAGMAACGARFADLLKRYPLYANVGIAGPDGRILCSAVPLPRAMNAADHDWFERAVRTGRFAVGQYEHDAGMGRAVLVAAHPVPYPGGGTQSVLFAALDLAWLGQIVGAAQMPEGWTVSLTDESGTIVARYPDQGGSIGQSAPEATVVRAILATRREGMAEVSGAGGEERLYAFTVLRTSAAGRPAYLSISIPRRATSAEANRILTYNLIGLGVVVVLALLAAWIGGNLVVIRRVSGIVTATERLAAGDLRARAAVGGGDEIGVLARAFNGMADRLEQMVEAEQQARAALATRVDELVAQRTREATLLTQLSELLQACLTPEETYAVIGQMVGQLFPADEGTVLVIEPSRTVVKTVATWGAARSQDRHVFPVDECWALRRGRVYRVEDCRSGLLCQHLGPPLPAAYVCVPLMAQGEALGVLHLATSALTADGPPGRLDESRERLAITVAEQFALALANVKLRETLWARSTRDPLTGLFNRRYMEETLERELRRAEREHKCVSVIMLDIDQFKRFNDDFGHEAGDSVLAALGSLLQVSVRGGDVACRYGGEEFVLILPEATAAAARRRADEVREAISRLQLSHLGLPLGPVRCSMGVATYPGHAETGAALLRAADAALYRAKHAGRDQVIVAEGA